MTLAVDRPLPSLRCCRSRRTTFSMSMMASSTMSPRAITNPARTIVLMVVPRAFRTSTAASSDSGMATTLISAVRQEYRNRASITIISRAPRIRALVRLSIASSMNVAGRKIWASMAIPGRPGRSSSSAASTPLVTSRVLAQGSFSTMSMRPSPWLMTASPMSGWWSLTRSATWLRRICRPSSVTMGRLARSSWVTMGCTCRIPSRWSEPSTQPPRPMKWPLEYRCRPASSASEVAVMTCSRVTFSRASRCWSTWTWSISSRSPQMGTLATPGTRSRRVLIFQ